MGLAARSGPRSVKCAFCRKGFTARSGKAKYCSPHCTNRANYLKRTDGFYRTILQIHRQVNGLIGRRNLVDAKLIQIADFLDQIERQLKVNETRTGKLWQD